MEGHDQDPDEIPPLPKAVSRRRSKPSTAEPVRVIAKPMINRLCEIARSLECATIGRIAWDLLSEPQRDRLFVMATNICRRQPEAVEDPAANQDTIKPIEPVDLCYHYLHRAFGMWMYGHNVTQWEAIVSLSRKMGRLSADDAKALWTQVSDAPVGMMPGYLVLPVWIKRSRQLWLDDALIRTIASDRPTTIELVLDAFESKGWRGAIQWPPAPGNGQGASTTETTSRGLSDLIRSLNKGLTGICFRAHGHTISWSHVI